jgi:hypothetical protein
MVAAIEPGLFCEYLYLFKINHGQGVGQVIRQPGYGQSLRPQALVAPATTKALQALHSNISSVPSKSFSDFFLAPLRK